MPRRPYELPLWLSLLVAPIAGVLAMAGLAVASFVLMSSLSGDIVRLGRDVFRDSERLSGLRLAVVTARADLLDLAAYAANSSDDAGLRKRVEIATAALAAAQDRIAGFSAIPEGPGTPASALAADLDQWRGFASDAATTLASDSATGMMVLGNAQALFPKVSASLDRIVGQMGAQTDAIVTAAESRVQHTRIAAPISVLILGVVGGLLSLLTARRIGARLRRLRTAMARIAEGDLDAAIPPAGSRDELALMAEALQTLRASAQERLRLEREREAQQQADRARTVRLKQLTEAFRGRSSEVGRGLAAAAASLLDTADAMAGEASRTAAEMSQIALLASSSDEAASLVAAAAEQVSDSIVGIAEQVERSGEMTQQAAQEARRADQAVGLLADAATRIGSVIALINEIAGRTNLLALNATIEAARAGEAGRGFAVVAQEVKALAAQTGAATATVGEQIEQIRNEVQQTVATIGAIAQTVERSAAIGTVIAETVDRQKEATAAIVGSVARAASASRDMNTRFGQISAATDRATVGAKRVSGGAETVNRDAAQMTEVVETFIADMLAA